MSDPDELLRRTQTKLDSSSSTPKQVEASKRSCCSNNMDEGSLGSRVKLKANQQINEERDGKGVFQFSFVSWRI